MPSLLAMTASCGGALLGDSGGRRADVTVRPLFLLCSFFQFCVARTDSATDRCFAQAKESRMKEAAFRGWWRGGLGWEREGGRVGEWWYM